MSKFLSLVLLGMMSLGCVHTQSSPGTRLITVAPDAELVQIEVRAADGVRQLPRDTEIPIRQDFALTVELGGPGYVYLVRSPKTEPAQRLYPTPGSLAVAHAAGRIRIPGSGAWLRLDQFGAEDLLCLLLSAQPLPPEDQRCEPVRPGGRNDDDPKTPPVESQKTESPPPPPAPPVDPRGPDQERRVKMIRLMVQNPR